LNAKHQRRITSTASAQPPTRRAKVAGQVQVQEKCQIRRVAPPKKFRKVVKQRGLVNHGGVWGQSV
jgi:hypothetical protein